MNNKGFTLIELLCMLFLISCIFFAGCMIISDTFSITDEKSYQLLKDSIILGVSDYINECDNHIIDCSSQYKWSRVDDKFVTEINLSILKNYNYFNTNNFINPITDKDISECLIINVIKDDNSNINVNLDDSKC